MIGAKELGSLIATEHDREGDIENVCFWIFIFGTWNNLSSLADSAREGAHGSGINRIYPMESLPMQVLQPDIYQWLDAC